ncbi:MAG TPA: methyltransferase domain-containing protein [Kiritimatiellia bacterium]|nr:methyltransferase domain-containing protein [Kiritimatiellia bacterium]
MTKNVLGRLMYWARDLRSRALFEALESHCRGDVLDVGGWDFFKTIKKRRVEFTSWTILEVDRQSVDLDGQDERIRLQYGDGCAMTYADASFDTVVNIQVLEHVFEPIRMMEEMTRVLKPGGYMILLLPTTSTLHMAPYHYYNFTRYWSEEALARCGLKKIMLKPLGGVWSSMASHLVYFVMQSLRVRGMSTPEIRRNVFFYLLYPFMLLFAAAAFPVCMLLSLGDLAEEANNHLVVARKPIDFSSSPHV